MPRRTIYRRWYPAPKRSHVRRTGSKNIDMPYKVEVGIVIKSSYKIIHVYISVSGKQQEHPIHILLKTTPLDDLT
ncbi:hypothetical protein WN55_07229 [Dufourea novaeangliae]|uniref:Uncharacterized protein n=1 Tax=Dufourea novaeangliae TaxID=178035 RepID=A0A154PRP7_DUFNO|nr:hypothetical protein WN55_07229 [Dufourea novaeangliae]